MSPWLRKNVINEEFMNEIKRLKANGCHVKIIFGYKMVTKMLMDQMKLQMN